MQHSLDVAPSVTHAESLDSFRSAVNSSFVPLQVESEAGGPFQATLSAAGADGVVFTEVRAKPQLVRRTEETIESGGSGYYKVSLLLSGSGILIQDGREIIMNPGDMSFYDTSRPYSLLFNETFRNLIMMFPKDRLEFPTILTDSLTAVSLGEQHHLAKVIAPFIAQASPQLPMLPSLARTKLAHTSLDLINTMLSAILDVENSPRSPHEVLLQKIYGHINTNLGSPTLSPGSIAAAHYISVRHLHALFAEHDTTVSTVIKQRRLEHARADLTDPAFSTKTVAAIAARWGFVDAAHFSRVFKQHYGVSPSELRAL
ncbi:helix-turn-helix domain-containing protein [Leucobacter sp. UT-8R-CII-1-4]|uniref:AraC-like ligand-binding domain-containing protein n=1 Tax=Leucobacter sp. UT-8R-CII-1-4 TaxID=3040075 RepID=UPI0024A7D2BC|nr:helix-turn-helix domain-containing protein [Leucobacter sp. UT-8R-CII-1-4]MDI6022987.1 helix-turn-helix domain-containing protein [Leucobacter sp. UT-8R-CII-1-4]